jgi:hypothetical protein
MLRWAHLLVLLTLAANALLADAAPHTECHLFMPFSDAKYLCFVGTYVLV